MQRARALGVLPDGTWFPGLAAAHLRAHAAPRLEPGETAAARGAREIRRVARKAAIASALAAAGVTGGGPPGPPPRRGGGAAGRPPRPLPPPPRAAPHPAPR